MRLYVYMDTVREGSSPTFQEQEGERPRKYVSGTCGPQSPADPERSLAPMHVRVRPSGGPRPFAVTDFASPGLLTPRGSGSGPACRNLGVLFAVARRSPRPGIGVAVAAPPGHACASSGPRKPPSEPKPGEAEALCNLGWHARGCPHAGSRIRYGRSRHGYSRRKTQSAYGGKP